MSIASTLAAVTAQLDQMIIFRSLRQHAVVQELYACLRQTGPTFYGWYGRLLEQFPDADNSWAAYLDRAIRYDENSFALHCERGEYIALSPRMLDAVRRDIRILQNLKAWNPRTCLENDAKPWKPLPTEQSEGAQSESELQDSLDKLARHYREHGTGAFGATACFTWNHASQAFQAVAHPDPVTFEQLIGYERQKQTLQQNTLQFLQGLPANNVLLYGDRGTGKSTSVKALINHYAPQGLRIIEVRKENLEDFPVIIDRLKDRGLKFILYVDDLSFESTETQYKHLKALLEGGLETRPANVLIYATSNRRHLLKETFADRESDVHGNDTIQEQLSLSDRFGITITFTSPNHTEFLEIVRGLAAQRGLTIDEELTARALQWERFHNGRSGRTAKQFIDHLQGELALNRA